MGTIEPYLFFRFFLFALFAGFLIYDVIGLVVWYRGLPRLIQRIIVLKVLQVRTGRMKRELGVIGVLLALEGWLVLLLFGRA